MKIRVAFLAVLFLIPAIGGSCPDPMEEVPMPPEVVIPRIYGDGSAGAKVISEDMVLADVNLQYTDFTVNHGVTLTIQSGARIRCTGAFTNHGAIVVANGAEGGVQRGYGTSTAGSSQTPVSGIATRSAGNGSIGDASVARTGGGGGQGISEFETRVTLQLGVNAGGGAGAAVSEGADGGGSLTVLAFGAVNNNGQIMANGADGSAGTGGAGGGFVTLASAECVSNNGGASITADGGDGGASGSAEGPGGGGGGGGIHLIAPNIMDGGTTSVAAGSAGATGSAGSVTAQIRSAGGGGGAGVGNGGNGGSVSAGAAANPGDAEHGVNGLSIKTSVDPTSLF